MRCEVSTPADIAADQVNLANWFFSMTDEAYQAASPAHLAFGSFVTHSGKRGAIAVEEVGGALTIHHYEEGSSTPGCLHFTSPSTQAWVGRLLPFRFRVSVTMELRPVAVGKSEFVLTVAMKTRNLFVLPMMESPLMRWITTRHMRAESVLFVRDMIEKYS
jgi:hypothetical protein